MRLESLEELRVFLQIVESGGLTAAARVLGMPTNTVSRRLQALEDRLGTVLLYRTTRSQSLSEAGRTLLVRARRILGEVESTEAALQREAEGLVGVVRVSVPSILTGDFFRSMGPLMFDNPGLRLQVEVNDRPVSPVTAGVDVVVIGGGLADSTLIARKLTDVHLVLVASEDYIAAHGAPRTPTDLAVHQTLHFKTDPPQSTWVLLDEAGEEHVVPVEGKVEVGDGRGLLDALRAGLGVAMMSPRLVGAHPELRQVCNGYSGRTFPVFAVYPTSGQRSARLLAVVDRLRHAMGA